MSYQEKTTTQQPAEGRALSIAEVYITEALSHRAPKKTDYLKEKLALQELAARMADQPDEILPKFVDLALEMAEGSAAGISLYEKNPAPGVFRWHHVRGAFAPFEGATTPRNFSPCGVTLDANGPVLSTYPERVYDWIAATGISVPEVLLVPVYLGKREPSGTLWIVSPEVGHLDQGHARVAAELASFVGIALRMRGTEEQLQQALIEQQTLTMEMSHRIKNLFAMVDGLVRLTARGAESKEQMARDLSARLQALSDAHSLVRPGLNNAGPASTASDLCELVALILRPYCTGNGHSGARFYTNGPTIGCGARATNSLALVIHELATNAVKYGALGVDGGHVDVKWEIRAEQLVLTWIERDGPIIEGQPDAAGFGSALAGKIVVRQFGGVLNYDWRPDGLAVTITLPLEELSN